MTPRTLSAEPFVPEPFKLGEGPFWWEDRLWWVEIEGGLLLSVAEDGSDRRQDKLGRRLGAAVPMADGRFAVALEDGIGVLDRQTGRVDLVFTPEDGLVDSRFNDGKCDPRGRFLAGTMSMKGKVGTSALYSVDLDGSVNTAVSSVSISNGLAWSSDGGTLYYIDTPTGEVVRFGYDLDTGGLGERSVAVEIPDAMGKPDGMCIDDEGNLWVAHWEGSAVRCWSPVTGECLAEIPVPCLCPTSCCFGGPDRSRLFITSAGGWDNPMIHPLAGSVFVCDPGVTGPAVSVARFAVPGAAIG